MKLIADLHFHSKYSRAVSQEMVLPEIARWARIKGIDLVTTSDFTHPVWLRELKANLEEVNDGVYRLKGTTSPKFIFTTEISSIYSQGGKTRRIHNIIFAPNMASATKIEEGLATRGNVMSDGRPIFGMSAQQVTEFILGLDPLAMIVPAHAWTPWFSVYGSESGFDSLDECFGKMADNIFAVETGLSSDPLMNWKVEELDKRSIISNSDAHSGAKLGREATVFEVPDTKLLRYQDIREAIIGNGVSKISHTLEFYPEEGKYHYTGHRNCQIKQSPEETIRLGTSCPVCGRPLTVGVMHRVQQIAGREVNNQDLITKTDGNGVKWIGYKERPLYAMLVPLLEIIAESIGSTTSSQKVNNEYKRLTENLGGEFKVLLQTKPEEIIRISGDRIAEGIMKVRSGDIVVDPGYDGVFGTVQIWSDGKKLKSQPDESKEQMSLFS